MTATRAQQLRKQNEAGRVKIPIGTLAVMDRATAELTAVGPANSSLGVGATVSDFTLPDATGTQVALSSLLTKSSGEL